jgi:hypothetical protein
MTIRPPQAVAGERHLVLHLETTRSTFIDEVRKLRDPRARERLREVVDEFVRSADFIDSRSRLDERLLGYHARLLEIPDQAFSVSAADLLKRVFDVEPAAFSGSEAFGTLRRRLAESILAAALDGSVSGRTRSLLSTVARVTALVEALAVGRTVTKLLFLDHVIVLPRDVLPGPRDEGGLIEHRNLRRKAQRQYRAERLVRLETSGSEISMHRRAVGELLEAVSRRTATAESNPDEDSHTGFFLTPRELDGLSENTRSVLASIRAADGVDISRAINLIEARTAGIAKAMNGHLREPRMTRIGANIIPAEALAGMATEEQLNEAARHPGPCPPLALEEVDDEGAVTVPTGHGDARILGIADLMIVEQKLARYELGEIAHIENVLEKETRERRFRTSTTTEESALIETETTDEKEKDLSSTERFELQSETQNVINENASLEAGLTVNASYGPSVDATATLNAASSSARQHSDRASSTFARETTSRAVSRLQKRTLERRFYKTVREVEEKNLHRFENPTGGNITGIYRFVDKIYDAQVVNYGKRLMLEFIVPEPAAFWRHALAKQPIEAVQHVCPDPPGYCVDGSQTFVPLQAQDIEPDNYVFWASKYGAEDVTPPPPTTLVVGVARKGTEIQPNPTPNGPLLSSLAFEVEIPDGYRAVLGHFKAYGQTQSGGTPQDLAQMICQVQALEYAFTQPVWKNVPLDPAAKVTVSVNTTRFYNYEFLITIFCTLTDGRREEWKLNTFFAIQNAYRAAKTKYDNAVEAARIRAGYDVSFGRNPLENREIEKTELKRACISLATGQRFDTFDAMNRHVAPFGFPEIDFAEAKAEARYIQLFEQGFEWHNLTYVFYPYFWSRKDAWPTLAQLSDGDPLFTRFLQAGAARVQVPVRLGFESSILNYLAGVNVWDGEGNLVAFDDDDPHSFHFSLLNELKSQLGNNDIAGVGTLSVTQGQAGVIGSGTAFHPVDDLRRRINIAGDIYVVKTITDAQEINLDRPYEGPTDGAATYTLGGQLIGEPWEVRLPTSLVKLDDYAIS